MSLEQLGTDEIDGAALDVSVRDNKSGRFISMRMRSLTTTRIWFQSPIPLSGRIAMVLRSSGVQHEVEADVAVCRRQDLSGVGQHLVGCEFASGEFVAADEGESETQIEVGNLIGIN